MAFLTNNLVTLGFGREVFLVLGAEVIGAGSWRAVSQGSSSNGAPSSEVILHDADDGVSVFKFGAPAATPVGKPAPGSLVLFQESPVAWTTGAPVSMFPGTERGPQGILLFYLTLPVFGPGAFPVITLPDGSQFTGLVDELVLLRGP